MSERELFLAALERDDPRARASYLDWACAGDAALRARVEALLRSHDEAGSFLKEPATSEAVATVGRAAAEPGRPPAPTLADVEATGDYLPGSVADDRTLDHSTSVGATD